MSVELQKDVQDLALRILQNEASRIQASNESKIIGQPPVRAVRFDKDPVRPVDVSVEDDAVNFVRAVARLDKNQLRMLGDDFSIEATSLLLQRVPHMAPDQDLLKDHSRLAFLSGIDCHIRWVVGEEKSNTEPHYLLRLYRHQQEQEQKNPLSDAKQTLTEVLNLVAANIALSFVYTLSLRNIWREAMQNAGVYIPDAPVMTRVPPSSLANGASADQKPSWTKYVIGGVCALVFLVLIAVMIFVFTRKSR